MADRESTGLSLEAEKEPGTSAPIPILIICVISEITQAQVTPTNAPSINNNRGNAHFPLPDISYVDNKYRARTKQTSCRPGRQPAKTSTNAGDAEEGSSEGGGLGAEKSGGSHPHVEIFEDPSPMVLSRARTKQTSSRKGCRPTARSANAEDIEESDHSDGPGAEGAVDDIREDEEDESTDDDCVEE
jgi:hypothetical protein